MIQSYLNLALRLLIRNPFFTFINVAGLSVGFAVFFILWPFSQSELKSDQFIKDHERIGRILMDWRWTDNGGESWGHIYLPSAASYVSTELKGHADVVDATRFLTQNSFWSTYTPDLKPQIIVSMERAGQTQIQLRLEHSICADKNFFEFFSLPLVSGNPGSALSTSEGVVISQTISDRFFGDENPLGKFLKVNNSLFQVTGVFQDLPHNSHLLFDMVFSNVGKLPQWNSIAPEVLFCKHYFKTRSNLPQLTEVLKKNKDRLIGNYLNANQHLKIDFLLEPLEEIAFSGNFPGDNFKTKSRFTLDILAGVSLVVLIMAWMNYINLTISRTKTRFKEIAARKVSGALVHDLFFQFICQSAVINVLSALIALTIIQLVRQPFHYLLNIRIIPISSLAPGTILFFFIFFITGIVATASYPVWVMLQYNTRQLLNRDIPPRMRVFTSVLTTSQYVAALTLVAWIFVMYSQLNFVVNKNLGVDQENVVVIDAPIIGLEENGNNKMTDFVNRLKSRLDINDISLSGRVCGDQAYNISIRRLGKKDAFYGIDSYGGVDENFISLYKINILAGRNFVKGEKNESIILSRLAAERLGFNTPEAAIGSLVEFKSNHGWIPVTVIGVVSDYRVEPYLISPDNTQNNSGRGQSLTYMDNVWTTAIPERVSVKLNPHQIADFDEQAERIFTEYFPGNLFHWYFLNEHVGLRYGDQKIIRNQISLFTILAVGVACLGLLGMISNKATEKSKEISIRRILGAEGHQVTGLLLSSTFKQIVIAVVIGLIVAWKFSQQYLTQYSARIELQWWHFALPVLILLVIMFVSIGSVLWKATSSNPVEALKYE